MVTSGETASPQDAANLAPRSILARQQLRDLAARGVIVADQEIPEGSFQPASIDLRLGPVAHRLRCSFLPGADDVTTRLDDFAMGSVPLEDGGILESGRPYLIPLLEGLRLPRSMRGQTNPKSSTGRLDIFTRVITNGGRQFDEIAPGYQGPLFLEVFSRTFTIKVRTGRSLNQLRLFTEKAECDDSDLEQLHRAEPIAYRASRPVGIETLRQNQLSDGLILGVDLSPGHAVGFRAKRNSHLLDLDEVGGYEAEDYWEEVHSEPGGQLVLEPEEFYLLVSKEAVSIPPSVAADMVAFDPTSGELRTHYAGFFDPGFGYSAEGRMPGSRAVMEVRAHDVPFAIQDGQRVAKLKFSWMAQAPDVLYGASAIESHYQGQGDLRILPKQFRVPRPRDRQPELRGVVRPEWGRPSSKAAGSH